MTYARAAAIARDVREGRVTATEVLERHLARAAATRTSVNALVATRDDDARAEARRIDMQVRSGASAGLLAGVPFTVKDVVSTRDLPTTCGSRALAGNRTGVDATAVARLRRAGAVLVGKTNTPEFAFGIHTVNDLHGETHNPLGPFTVGGSSGGEAAAVAAGISAFGIGTDFGGSLRWPAQCTELVGLRPSVGLVPQDGQLPLFGREVRSDGSLQSLVQVIGPLAHDTVDAALILSVLADRPELRHLPETTVDLSTVDVSYGSSLAGQEADPEISDAVQSAALALGDAGARLAGVLPQALSDGVDVYDRLRGADSHAALRNVIAGHEDLVESRTVELLARPVANDDSWWRARRALLTTLEAALGESSILLMPVSFTPPFIPGERSVEDFTPLLPSRAVSLFGLPAVSVPWCRSEAGRPISVQIVAPRLREDLVIACALALEKVRPQREVTPA